MKIKQHFYTNIILCSLLWIYNLNPVIGQPFDAESDSLEQIIQSHDTKAKLAALIMIGKNLSTQNPDSAEAYLRQALMFSDSLFDSWSKMEVLFTLGNLYLETNRLSESKEAIEESLLLAKKENATNYLMRNQLIMAELLFQESNFDSALVLLQEAQDYAVKNGLAHQQAVISNQKAKIADVNGNRLQAINFYLQAVKYYIKAGDKGELAVLYNNIGTLHMSLGNHSKAYEYLLKASAINKELGRLVALNMNYINLGVLCKEADSLDAAGSYFLQAMDLSRKTNNEFELARVFLNMGNLSRKEGQFSNAKLYFDSSLFYCQKNGLEYGILLNNINMGGLLTEEGDFNQAIALLTQSEVEIKRRKLPEQTSEVYQMLSEAYKKSRHFEEALSYYEKYITLKDSIAGVQMNKTILELETKYEQEKSAHQMAQLSEQVLTEKAQKRVYFIGFLLISLVFTVVGFLFFFHRKSTAFNAKLAIEQHEKLQLKMEVRDKELVSKALQTARLNEIIYEVNNQIYKLMPNLAEENAARLNQIVGNLKAGLPTEAWKEFETRFEQVNHDFYQILLQRFPDLSPAELKICSFLRLNLNTKDIVLLTNRSIRTIENSRSSIRRKLNLEPDDNLTSFLLSL